MSIFKGAGVAIVTPMKENNEVDYDRFGELLDFQINNQTDAIVVCGTTGEAATLSHEEHLACIKFTVDYVNKRVPVIAGTGSNCTETAIYLSKQAEEYGVDGLLVVTPYYNKATQNGLKKHFTAIANSVKVPIILYNVPSRTGCALKADTIVELARTVDNIVAVKEASGDISFVADLMQKADGCIDVYSGNDDQIVPVLSLGGVGVISVLSNICPKETHDIVDLYLNGNVKESLALQLKYLPVCHNLFTEVNPIPVKTALKYIGIDCGSLRSPLTDMEEENAVKLREAMKATGINVK
ncbi:MAG: 4-hydroxy-tetrahydrodipicolinate synthase [bacterium]|nr:4-hydroxy-tetrahydrodipicolinate synthase [bacterium]